MARILVADDDPVTRDMVKRALEGDGHAIEAVADGEEALAAFERAGGFDLVVTDVDMPGLDGLTLAERMIAAQPDQRIIIMSVIADELGRAREFAGARVRVMSKPITLDKIRGEAIELLS